MYIRSVCRVSVFLATRPHLRVSDSRTAPFAALAYHLRPTGNGRLRVCCVKARAEPSCDWSAACSELQTTIQLRPVDRVSAGQFDRSEAFGTLCLSSDRVVIQRDYAEGLLRDGNGILQWFMSMHDIKQPEKQMALRADLQKTKFTIEMSCLQRARLPPHLHAPMPEK
eukprot:scaffold53336_cov100-Phaeocystis_antarctica.AAC.1